MDEEIRSLERQAAVGDKTVIADLERAYLRGGYEIQYVNLVLTEKLSALYLDDKSNRQRIKGVSIYDVASAINDSVFGIGGRNGFNTSVRQETDAAADRWDHAGQPYVFVVASITWMDKVCVGFAMTRGQYRASPDEFWPCLSPWTPPTDKGLNARAGRILAFAKNPPKGVVSFSRQAALNWAQEKLKTGAWLNNYTINELREQIGSKLGAYLKPPYFLSWVASACDYFLDREINKCVSGRPDLGPLVRLLGLSWQPWASEQTPTFPYADATREGDAATVMAASGRAQATVRETLRISSQEIPDWVPPKTTSYRGNGPYHQRPVEPRPTMPNAHRKHRKYR